MPRRRFRPASTGKPTAPPVEPAKKPTAPEEGYDYVLAEKPPRDLQTECPICQLLLRDPCQLECCGTLICAVCLNDTFKKGHKSCPLCRKSNPSFFYDKNHKRMIEGLSVFCKHHQEEGAGESGCKWVGELGQLKYHLNVNPSSCEERMKGCQYVSLKCNYCQKEVARFNLEEHEKRRCPQRKAECRYCGYVGSHEVVTGPHLKRCVNYPIPCEYCKEPVRAGYIDHHIREECSFFPVACIMREYGCTKRFPRGEMADHMIKSQAKHIEMVKKCLRDKEREKEAEIFKLSSKLSKISSQNARLSSHNEHLLSLIEKLHSTIHFQQIRQNILFKQLAVYKSRLKVAVIMLLIVVVMLGIVLFI